MINEPAFNTMYACPKNICANLKATLKTELSQELENILSYWIEHSIDIDHGGFIGEIDFYNKRIPKAAKGAVLNARILWTYSAAFNLNGKQEYLKIAHRAYDYFQNHIIDTVNGGVHWELSYKGQPTNSRKQIYALSFAIYGLTEYYKSTSNLEALHIAIDLFNLIERHSLDPVNGGYIEAFSSDWKPLTDFRLSKKDANESKTMNTHLHILEAYTNLYRVYRDKKVQVALKNLILLFQEKFITSNFNLNLFFDDQWNLKSHAISFGHNIECAWLIYEAAEVLDDAKLKTSIAKLSVQMAQQSFKGIDTDFGLFNEFFPKTNSYDTDKHWWPQAEALVGFYNAYEISGNVLFLNQAQESWNFIKSKIIDTEHGEWYWRVNKQGMPYNNEPKAGFWKCPYHNSRTCMELLRRIKS